MDNLPPKQQVQILLEQCLATGVRGRVAEIIKHAQQQIEKRDEFTDSFYDSAITDVSDPNYPGLVFKVSKRSRRWIYRYTPHGAQSTKQTTLGYFPEMSVAQARQAWFDATNPDNKVAESKISYPVSQLVADYLRYAKSHRSDWRRERRFLERHFDDIYGELAAESISQQQIEKVIEAAKTRAMEQGGHGQRAKEYALSTIRHMYDVARGKSDFDDSSLPWIDPAIANPTEAISVVRKATHQSPIFASDVGRYAKALVGLPIHADLQAMLLLQLYTASPFSILCRLEWQHVDWANQCLRISSSKAESVVIALSSAAMQLLEQRKRSHQSSRAWVFSATKQTQKPMPIRYPTTMLAALRNHLQLPSHFTSGRLVRFSTNWHQQIGGVIGQTGTVVSESHIRLVGVAPLVDGAEQWHQYLTNLRQTC